MLASCQRDSDVTDSFPNYPDNNQVGISTSVEKGVKGMQTKFADEVSYTTYSGKTLGLCIDCLSDDGGSHDYTNVKWSTADAGASWYSESQMLWESAESENNIFAYAPYVTSYSSSSTLTFAVKSDQSTEEKVTASDFATFNADDYVPGEDLTSGQSIPVLFTHKMVKLFITFNHGDVFTDDEFTNYTVSVKAKGEVTCDPSDGSVITTTAAASSIVPMISQENNTAEVIIAPQTIAADAQFIELTINNTVYSFTMSSDYTFESGRPYSLKIKIGKDKIETTSVTVADWDAEADVTDAGHTNYVVFTDAAFQSAVIEEMVKENSALSGITFIDVTDPDQLAALKSIISLSISNKLISSVSGIKYLTGLKYLYCDGNSLSELDLSDNTGLTDLYCAGNKLTNLNVSNITGLTNLYCYYNSLSELDLSDNTGLTNLYCSDNSLSELDLSDNTELTYLDCGGNSLSELDLSNNTVLTYLDCSGNSLSVLDLSDNTVLTNLDCSDNSLSELDLSNNTGLTDLVCVSNKLTNLNVFNITGLTNLYCYDNSLSELDLSDNTGLTNLYCSDNSLSELDLSDNTVLTNLDCSGNNLTNLNVSNNTGLTELNCLFNRLLTLDFSNTETADYYLLCGNQTSDGSTSQQLTLKLTAAQEDYWENTGISNLSNNPLADISLNSNVVVTND